MLSSPMLPWAERTMNGMKMREEKRVLSRSTGMTALAFSDCFLKTS